LIRRTFEQFMKKEIKRLKIWARERILLATLLPQFQT
jgi:hypothetical protein